MSYTHQDHEETNQEYLAACHKGGKMTGLVVSLCTDDPEIGKAALRAEYDMLKKHVSKADEDYSFLIGLSNSDGSNHKKKVPYHTHAVIKGENSDKFTQEIVRRINRKAQLANEKLGIEKRAIPAKTHEVKGLHGDHDDCGMRYVKYITAQCDYTQQYSNADEENKFNFRNFK
jgi:hypothetical protein